MSIPNGARSGQVLLLVEFPGREYRPSQCVAQVDAKPVPLRESNSSEHAGYYMASKDNFWKDILPMRVNGAGTSAMYSALGRGG